jgi:hypothetical protein
MLLGIVAVYKYVFTVNNIGIIGTTVTKVGTAGGGGV